MEELKKMLEIMMTKIDTNMEEIKKEIRVFKAEMEKKRKNVGKRKKYTTGQN